MLLYVFRVLRLLIAQSLRPRVDALAPLDLSFRAWPWYCDTNLHVNNAHYLTYMEYGRWALSLRSGLLAVALRRRWSFLLAGASMVYRRPLPMWKKLTVRTQLVRAEGRWFYFVQELFDHEGRPAARAVLRATVRGRSGAIDAAEVTSAMGTSQALPATPASHELLTFDALTREHLTNLEADASRGHPSA